MPKFMVRWMIRRDMADVLEIERNAFESPWTGEEFLRNLRKRNCIGMSAEYVGCHADRVVGFMIYELHAKHLHVLNFAVAADVRRRGVGTQMVEKLISRLGTGQRRTRITLELRETNVTAQVFFRSLGFVSTGIIHDYYEDTAEDAYLMEFRQNVLSTLY